MSSGSRLPSPFFLSLVLFLPPGAPLASQETSSTPPEWMDDPLVMASATVVALLAETPACLQGYRPEQSGPLIRIVEGEEPFPDTTFTVEPMQFESEGFRINGWLYLPDTEGPHPLIVLNQRWRERRPGHPLRRRR